MPGANGVGQTLQWEQKVRVVSLEGGSAACMLQDQASQEQQAPGNYEVIVSAKKTSTGVPEPAKYTAISSAPDGRGGRSEKTVDGSMPCGRLW